MTRVAVFIDYENSRFGAREVFGDRDVIATRSGMS